MDQPILTVRTHPVGSFSRSRIDDPIPHVHLLSNRKMVSMITAAGSGYLEWDNAAVTRWQGDRTRDADGIFLYLRDLDSGKYWSAGFQPTLAEPDEYQADFHIGSAEIVRCDNQIRSRLEVCVAPDCNVELRRCEITNLSGKTRRIEITSYAEFVLQDARADLAHPAFSKLFVQTEYLREQGAIVAHRRKRSEGERTFSACHFMACDDEGGPEHFETDRCRFIGRGRDVSQPEAMRSRQKLSGTSGSVLDPIASLRRTFILPPNASACVTYFIAVGSLRHSFADTIEAFRRRGAIDETFAAARQAAQQQIAGFGLSDVALAQALELAGALLYGAASDQRQAKKFDPARLTLQMDLPAGVTHELPLLSVRISDRNDLETVKSVLSAAHFLRKHRVPANVVVLNQAVFREDIDHLLSQFTKGTIEIDESRRTGGVEVYESMDLSDEQYQWIQSQSRVCLNGDANSRNSLNRHIHIDSDLDEDVPSFGPADVVESTQSPREELQFENGIGGFSSDGSEYVLYVGTDGQSRCNLPPMPWTNVISNESAGVLVTETGAGYTWVGNSRENRLTPWYNDPVCDPHGEAHYLRDEDLGVFWSPMPGPVGLQTHTEVRHGMGYSIFRKESHELTQEVLKFVPRTEPLAITRIKIRNTSARRRRLSLFSCLTWELSSGGQRAEQQVYTFTDEWRRTVFAANHAPREFSRHVAFASLLLDTPSDRISFTSDRSEFLGRNGNPANPRAVRTSTALTGRCGRIGDPCAASQAYVELDPGETLEYAILLGQKETMEEAIALIDQFSTLEQIEEAFVAVKQHWRNLVSKVQIETPVPEIDLMVNGWLAYQNLSCRLWGRSAYYQSGGAFGFRDQLQDSSALVYHDPQITRRQILLHAAHQFVEGDVLHWWHPPQSCGIRTRFSDDLIWLPLIAAEYVQTTGDEAIWQEEIRFLTARAVPDRHPEIFVWPQDSGETGSLYEHCCRSLDRSLTQGEHGLPLIGCGDWNDGMNRVGQAGLGESVWMGFFLDYAIARILPVCERFDDQYRVKKYASYRESLRTVLNNAGWDGQWYRRAYFDDGTPLGTAEADECRIDALVQAWAVMSGVAPPERAASAIAAVEQRLVDESAGMIKLLTPPFNQMDNDPGYIKGYLPGVRENGGQYTHGVLWYIRAMAELGHGTRAVQLLKMLSPVSHTSTPEVVATYKTEPYVIAADVYGEEPHIGRAGWTWYTGSAGWMFRVAFESILGFGIENGATLRIDPRIDAAWPKFTMRYRLPDDKTVYNITVLNPDNKQCGVTSSSLDGDSVPVAAGVARIPLLQDGQTHQVEVRL